MGPTSKWLFIPRLPSGVSKLPRLGLLQLWGAITLRAGLWLKWSLKQSCSSRQEFFKGMSHAIRTHGNWVDSRLLVVGSQTANLTPSPSFGHNLCFRCPNGRCETILDIYVLKAFHWYKELFSPLSFNPWNRPLKIWESTGIRTPKMELPWGVRVHSLTPSHTPGSMLCDSRLPSWPATLQTLALVASPKLGLRQYIWITIESWHEKERGSPSYVYDHMHPYKWGLLGKL
jgi:hypothetical protein